MESRVDCGRKGKPRGELELLRGRGVGGITRRGREGGAQIDKAQSAP